METWYYEVVSIDGDYANLKRTGLQCLWAYWEQGN